MTTTCEFSRAKNENILLISAFYMFYSSPFATYLFIVYVQKSVAHIMHVEQIYLVRIVEIAM